jgi:hypothetical protein
MQCCASDTRSVLSAAIAHSRLQRAAVEALNSITTRELDHEQIDSLLLYLAKHGQHVRSLDLSASDQDVQLVELPLSLTKLDSLQLSSLSLELQPYVLRDEFSLTRLELIECTLLDGAQRRAAALMQLPDLQHLSFERVYDKHRRATFPTAVLSHLTKLTSLKLQQVDCSNNSSSGSNPGAALQPLQALTRLADLQLGARLGNAGDVTADMLSGADQLTRLVVSQQRFEPRALAGKSQLQHLNLYGCSVVPAAGVAQLLSELQHLTELTHLDLGGSSCRVWAGPSPPPAAYASLTASSQLQHLDFNNNILPSAAWQYMCPPGRTLPRLWYLNIRGTRAAPDTSALASCCPGLQSLITRMPCSTAQLAPLQRLTGLHTLAVGAGEADDLEGVQTLCQLTGLHELGVYVSPAAEARLLQLTQLTRLTALTFAQRGGCKDLRCNSQVS